MAAELEKVAGRFNRQAAEQKEWSALLERENLTLEARLQTECEANAELTKKIAEADFRLTQLQGSLNAKITADDHGENSEGAISVLLELVSSGDSPNPVECLMSVQAAYPEHCLVLPTAMAAAGNCRILGTGGGSLKCCGG